MCAYLLSTNVVKIIPNLGSQSASSTPFYTAVDLREGEPQSNDDPITKGLRERRRGL